MPLVRKPAVAGPEPTGSGVSPKEWPEEEAPWPRVSMTKWA